MHNEQRPKIDANETYPLVRPRVDVETKTYPLVRPQPEPPKGPPPPKPAK